MAWHGMAWYGIQSEIFGIATLDPLLRCASAISVESAEFKHAAHLMHYLH